MGWLQSIDSKVAALSVQYFSLYQHKWLHEALFSLLSIRLTRVVEIFWSNCLRNIHTIVESCVVRVSPGLSCFSGYYMKTYRMKIRNKQHVFWNQVYSIIRLFSKICVELSLFHHFWWVYRETQIPTWSVISYTVFTNSYNQNKNVT